jgi:hypothetical protein
MQKILFIFNCHGGQIRKQIEHLPFLFDEIIIYNYLLEGYPKDTLIYYDENDLEKIKNADILIVQNVKNLRGKEFIGLDHIKTIVKSESKIIKIPHYTFIGYFLSFDNNEKIDVNIYGTEEEIKTNFENSLEKIKILDEISDIKCYNFIKENYKKYRLFHSKIYPTYHLFHFIAQEICKILGLESNIQKKYSNYANPNNQIIFPNVQKYLELEFNIIDFCYNCTIDEYLTICKNLNINELYLFPKKKGRYQVKELENIRKYL